MFLSLLNTQLRMYFRAYVICNLIMAYESLNYELFCANDLIDEYIQASPEAQDKKTPYVFLVLNPIPTIAQGCQTWVGHHYYYVISFGTARGVDVNKRTATTHYYSLLYGIRFGYYIQAAVYIFSVIGHILA